MHKSFIILTLLIVFFAGTDAQEKPNESKELTDKIFAAYQKGKLEEAAEAGEKLIKLERRDQDSASYVTALVNLARIRRAYYAGLRDKIAADRPRFSEAQAMSELADENAAGAEALFREALAINEKNGRGRTAQTADIKKDLAWMISNYSGSGVKTVDKSRGRIDEAEKLLSEAITLSEQTGGRDADQTLFIVLDAGDFYYKNANFEKALPFYERFLQTYQQKHGANHPDLVNALRPYARILFTTFRDQESTVAVNRIEEITKKAEPKPQVDFDLYLRSKEAVAYSAPIIIEANKKAEDFRRRLKAQGKTLTAREASQMPRLKVVPVEVEVDETGKIIKAQAKTDDNKLKAEAEATVSAWTVRPFSVSGTAQKMRGTLKYRKPN